MNILDLLGLGSGYGTDPNAVQQQPRTGGGLLASILGGGNYGTDPSAATANAGQSSRTGGGLLSGILGDSGGDLYGDALTPAQKAAVQKRRLGGYLKSVAPYLGYSLDPGKVGSPMQILAAGLGGMGEEQDSAALNALRAGQLGLNTKALQQKQDFLNMLMGGMSGASPSSQAGSQQPAAGGSAGQQTAPASLTARQLVSQNESSGNPYVGYGGADLSKAPLDDSGFPIWSGKMGPQGISHAAGLYQFQPDTWRKYARPLGIKDFSPESQHRVFDAAYAAEGFAPWAPYNPRIAAALQNGGVTAAPQRPIQLAQAGPVGPGMLGGSQEPSGPMDVEARYNDAIRRGDTVRAQQILRGEPASEPAPAPALAPAGGPLAPGGAPTPAAPQTAPGPTPMLGRIPLTPENILRLGVAGDMMGVPSLGNLLTGTPAYKADVARQEKLATLPLDLQYAGPLAGAKAGGEFPYQSALKTQEANAQLRNQLAGLGMQLTDKGEVVPIPGFSAGQAALKGATTAAERAVTQPSDIAINQAKEGYQQVPAPGGGYALQPISGSPQERAQADQKAGQALQGVVVNRSIDRALGLSSHWTTGLLGSAMSGIPGTPAHDLATTLDTLKAQTGFTNLQQMRQGSPTGGALGAVSDFENRMLQASWDSLAQSQSKSQFESNLKNLRQVFDYTINGVPGLRDQLQQGKITRDQYNEGLVRAAGTVGTEAASAAPVQVKTLSEAQKLPSGTQFLDPFGTLRRVP